MLAIDTNLIVRYLTGDHPDQAARARAIIDRQPVFVAATVALKAEWMLHRVHGYRDAGVVRALRSFAGLPTVTVEDAARVATALDLAEKDMDFADALHLGRSAHCEGFATFDRKLVKAARAAGRKAVREV